jgi:hypothetical protein
MDKGVKVLKNGKVKVTRDDVTVQVGGCFPILKVAVSDKVGKKSYNTYYTMDTKSLFESPAYREQVADQFIDRALSQRGHVER